MRFIYYTLLDWFTAKATETLEERIAERVKEKNEKSKKGKSKDGTEAAESEQGEDFNRADVVIIFGSSKELAGFFDKMSKTKVTMGNGLKYRTVRWNNLRIAAVEAGYGEANIKKATEAMIQVFRPLRMMSAGFASALVPELQKNQIVISDRFLRESDGKEIDFRNRALAAPTVKTSLEKTNTAADTGTDSDKSKSEKEEALRNEEYIVAHPILSSEEYIKLESRLSTGTLLTADSVPELKKERRLLGEKFGASLMDRESWTVANICIEAGIPFLSVRIITEDMVPTAKAVRKMEKNSNSTARWLGALVGTVMKNPKGLVDVYQNREELLVASDKLAKTIMDIL